MKKTLLNLLIIILSVLLYACNSESTEKTEKQSNRLLNEELQEEHYQLIKEQSEWAREKDLFHRRLDTLKSIYDKLRPQHEVGYDELLEKIDKIMLEHFELIAALGKMTEEHTNTLSQHEANKIDDRQVQDQHKAFYLKHKEIDEKHNAIIEKYNELIKKVEEFVTKAGGKLPDLSNLQEVKSNATPQADTTKK